MTRLPYERLTEPERQALHAWLELHHVRPAVVPFGSVIEYDPATNEWLIETFAQRNGSPYLDADGEVVRVTVRRQYKAPLVWREVA